jgi:hypothetical protein
MSIATATRAIVVAACMVGGACAPAMAAPRMHHTVPAHPTVHRHIHGGTPAWARTERPFSAYAYSPPHALGPQPFSAAEQRWFNQARGNIW